jgi:hypothetical protein
MPGRMLQADIELESYFNYTTPTKLYENGDGHEDLEVRFTCRNCPASWDVDIAPDGMLRSGERNALLAHARVHTKAGSRMRRVTG